MKVVGKKGERRWMGVEVESQDRASLRSMFASLTFERMQHGIIHQWLVLGRVCLKEIVWWRIFSHHDVTWPMFSFRRVSADIVWSRVWKECKDLLLVLGHEGGNAVTAMVTFAEIFMRYR